MSELQDANSDKFQALRLQRFYLAQINYLITYVVIGVAWAAGQYDASAWMATTHVLLGILTQGVFLLLFKSGMNLRFREPSLTNPQIVVAILLTTYLLAFAGSLRGSLVMVYANILVFGIFQLSRRDLLLQAGLALACFGGLIALETNRTGSAHSLTLSLVQWFILACFLGCLTFTGSYIRELRERLQQRHSTLQAHQETLRGMMGQLQNLATTDGLTGLANRRYFIDETRRRMTLMRPSQQLGVALIDLDHFKRINDLYGHSAGDEVLQGFATLARDSLRDGDLVARFGGEEFVILLSNTDLGALHQCLERIRDNFAKVQFACLPEGVHCTLSAGLSLIRQEDDLEVCLNDADQALYLAKHSGRNRCEHHVPKQNHTDPA
ncbi:GGDEF domain-containing protein [Halopseudomonas sabulinigri]|uniref:diguanylate cyclase n=1 Tax=Halopseudomonas sabulinigri TaxID=472181 RepID=A0A1H1PTQ1_9GAMM|nr:GGDEF domain-containing protein [Halopseudomonas sabulinigri]SDS14568.1 diguanylate cyclase (GGDEF) domain-containing protein [Halopseudomonas sabulinigri]